MWATDTATAAAMAAAVAGSADKITQLSALRTSLGSGDRTETITRNGSLVYQATLTGEMTISNGEMSFGAASAVATALPIDLSSGTVVRRITGSNAGRYVEEMVGLTASAAPWKHRKSPTGKYGLPARYTIAADASLAPAPDALLTTFDLESEATAFPAHFHAPMLAHEFRPGDIPAGSFPKFRTAGGVDCPATLYDISHWYDGSMRMCCVLLRVPEALAANSIKTIQVRSGGDAPAAGTRTTANLTAADFNVHLVGVDGLSGTWVGSLNDGLSSGRVVKTASGPAGDLWEVDGDFKQDGAEHGQLELKTYVYALTNNAGAFGGLRVMGRVWQPRANPSPTTAARHRDVTCAVRTGAALIRNMVGHLDSETPGDTIRVPHGAGFFTAGLDGQYDFIQGGGTYTLDAQATVYVRHDTEYMISTGVIAPTVDQGDAIVIPAGAFGDGNDYRPHGSAGLFRAFGSTGGRGDLGVFPGFFNAWVSTPSRANARNLRAKAMVASGWKSAWRDKITKRPIPISDMGRVGGYPGLGTIMVDGYRCHHDHVTGYAVASPNLSMWSEDIAHRGNIIVPTYLRTGEPQFRDMIIDEATRVFGAPPPGVRTVMTVPPILSPNTGSDGRRVKFEGEPDSAAISGAGITFLGGREGAWGFRTVMMGALFTPSGSDENLYFTDAVNNCFKALAKYTVSMPLSFRNDGLWLSQQNGDTDQHFEGPWQTNFVHQVACYGTQMLRDNADALAWRKYLAKRYKRAHETFDLGVMVGAYRMSQYDGNNHMILSWSQATFGILRGMTWDSGTNRFTLTPKRTDYPWLYTEMGTVTPVAGDVWTWSPNQLVGPTPFPAEPKNKRYYVVNPVGQTFQLSDTPGGAPKVIPTSGGGENHMAQLHNMDIGTSGGNDGEYHASLRGTLRWHQRLGDTEVNPALAHMVAKCDARGDPETRPANEMSYYGWMFRGAE